MYIEHAEFDDEEKPLLQSNAKEESSDELPTILFPVPEKELSGWVMLDRLCGKYPAIIRKKVVGAFRYAIACSAEDIYYLPADERLAWKRYFAECERFVDEKIVKRRIAEGKDPDGDWRKEG